MAVRIIEGDCRDVLRGLPAESVQMTVTSPPYWGLRDYGAPPSIWDDDPDCSHEWGDTISVNATNHTTKARWNRALTGRDELQPTEKRVSWLRTEVKQGQFCQQCGAWAGAFGLEPTYQLYVEHAVEVFREVRRVLRPDGVLWLNLGDSYATGAGKVGDAPGGGEQGERWKGNRGVHKASQAGKAAPRIEMMGPMSQPNRMPQLGLKPKDLCGIPWRVAFALQADGWWLRQDIIWSKPNPMPESVNDRCTKSHEYLFLLTKSERYTYDAEAICEHAVGTEVGILTRNKRSVWTVATTPFPEAHFATFPAALVEPCVLAGCPPGGTVLDPFLGAGTTALVADRLWRDCIGIELNPEYAAIARKRLIADAGIFAEVAAQ